MPIDQGGEQVYFGLAATNSTDDQQIIPFFQPERERFLEYDLTKLIHNLAFPKKTVVGLVDRRCRSRATSWRRCRASRCSPTPSSSSYASSTRSARCRRDFDKVADDVDVLMIAQPQNLSEKTLYAIDQFVLKRRQGAGLRRSLFRDAAAHANRMNPSPAGTASNLDKLFAAWGVDMVPGKVAGDRRAARRVNAGAASRVAADRLRRLARAQGGQPQPRQSRHRRSVADQHGDAPAS